MEKILNLSKKLQITIVAVAALVVYLNILPNQFVIDDKMFINEWEGIRSVNLVADLQGVVPAIHKGVYRPVRTILQQVYYQLFRENSTGWHIHSILVHVAATILVYLVIGEIVKRFKIKFENLPFFTSLLFALHPIHTESITYLSASLEMVGIPFMLSALYFYLKKPKFGKIFFVLFYSLALFSYEIVLILPLIMLGIDYFSGELELKSIKKSAFWYLSASSIILLYLTVRVGILHITSRGNYLAYSFYHTQLVMITVYVKYIFLLIFPFKISYLHDLAPGFESFSTYYSNLNSILDLSIFNWSVLGSLLVLASLVGLGFLVRKKIPILSFSIYFFFVSLLPVSYIISQGIAMAEKYLYLASIGFILALVYLVSMVKSRKMVIATILLISFLYGILTIKRNFDWKNEVIFWRRLTVEHRNSDLSYYMLGVHLVKSGDLDGAKVAYLKAIELQPRMVEARFNLGNIYQREGKTKEALSEYLTILELDPSFEAAKGKVEELTGTHSN